MYLSNHNIRVHGYDLFRPLVEFWKNVLNNPRQLVRKIREYYPLEKEQFYELQKEIRTAKDSLEVAAMFFVLNRSSYSGMTLSGGMSPNHPRFTENSISKIEKFNTNNLTVEHMDFKDSIALHQDKLLYCDPPYYIESNNLYGYEGSKHKDFDHLGLYRKLSEHDRWILSYNNNSYIRELYSNFEQVELDWSYGTSRNSNEEPKELLILNL